MPSWNGASTVCLTFDFDALSVWLAYDGPTAAMLWRGEYGARVGVSRILGFDPGATFARTADVARSLPEAA